MAWEIVPIMFSIFGMPVAIVAIRSHYKALEKGLIGRRGARGELSLEEKRQLEELKQEKKQLEARVQNLESIVCSVDLELNARLNRLAAEQSRALPALAGGEAGEVKLLESAPTAALSQDLRPGQKL